MALPLRRIACVLAGLLPVGVRGAETAATAVLNARIMPTIQYAHADIYHRTPPGEPPHFILTRDIVAEQRLDIVVMANGAVRDETGKVNVVYDLHVRAPDGTTIEDRKDLRLALDRTVPAAAILFPTDIGTLIVKNGEPMGEYRVDVAVRDRVSGASATATQTVKVSADNTPLPWPEGADVLRWWNTYYLNPQPRLFLSALVELSRKPEVRNRPPPGQGALLGFGDQVLKDNPWLVPQLKAYGSGTRDEWEKRIVGLVLGYFLREQAETSDPRMREVLKTLPRESPEPLSGAQLDLAWGRFLAGAGFKPVQDLVQIVDRYRVYRPAYDLYTARPEPRGETSLDERRGLLHATALWSLGSNARQHKRVTHFLMAMRDAPNASETVKEIVDRALADPPPERPGRRQL